MKYNEILEIKKITKSLYYTIYYIALILISFIISYNIKNTQIFLVGIIIGIIIFFPIYIHIEKEIKEMEILLKLDKYLDKQNRIFAGGVQKSTQKEEDN